MKPVRAAVRRFPRAAGWIHDVVTRNLPLVPVAVLETEFEGALRFLMARQGPASIGVYLEFGVYRGDSLLCMQRASERLGLGDLRLIGFDSFEGLPVTESEQDRVTRSGGGLSYRPGGLRSPYADTVRSMTRHGADWGRIKLVPGWFSDTLTAERRETHALDSASVIMLDCVLHSSTMQALRFVEPLIKDEAIVFLDDWDAGAEVKAAGAAGERSAFESFLAEHPSLHAEQIGSYLHLEDNPPSQAVIMHVRRVNS